MPRSKFVEGFVAGGGGAASAHVQKAMLDIEAEQEQKEQERQALRDSLNMLSVKSIIGARQDQEARAQRQEERKIAKEAQEKQPTKAQIEGLLLQEVLKDPEDRRRYIENKILGIKQPEVATGKFTTKGVLTGREKETTAARKKAAKSLGKAAFGIEEGEPLQLGGRPEDIRAGLISELGTLGDVVDIQGLPEDQRGRASDIEAALRLFGVFPEGFEAPVGEAAIGLQDSVRRANLGDIGIAGALSTFDPSITGQAPTAEPLGVEAITGGDPVREELKKLLPDATDEEIEKALGEIDGNR